jgi:hypothetical protein
VNSDMGTSATFLQHSNNRETPCSTVAGAINDGGEVGSGVVEAAIKKRDARSALVLRNGQNTYSGKV